MNELSTADEKTAYIKEKASAFMAYGTTYTDADAEAASDVVRDVYIELGMEGACNLFACVARRIGAMRKGNNTSKLSIDLPPADPATLDSEERGERAALRWVVDVSNDDMTSYCVPYCEQALDNSQMIGELGSGLLRLCYELLNAATTPYQMALLRSRQLAAGSLIGDEAPACRAALDVFLAAAQRLDIDQDEWVEGVRNMAREAMERMYAAERPEAHLQDTLLLFVLSVCHTILDRISAMAGRPTPYGVVGALTPGGFIESLAAVQSGRHGTSLLETEPLKLANVFLEITLSDDAEALMKLMEDYRTDPDRAAHEIATALLGLASWLMLTVSPQAELLRKRSAAQMN